MVPEKLKFSAMAPPVINSKHSAITKITRELFTDFFMDLSSCYYINSTATASNPAVVV